MKKYLGLLIIILCIFSIITSHKIVSFVDKKIHTNRVYDYLLAKNLVHKCYSSGNINHPDFYYYFQQEGFDYNQMNDRIITKSLAEIDKIKNQIFNAETPYIIPLITHRVYFSEPDNNELLNNFYLAMLENSYQKLESFGPWRHIFWTNKPSLITEGLKKKYNIEIRTINEFHDERIFNKLKETVNVSKNPKAHYSKASDIIRVLALKKYGGIYTDMDYEFYQPMLLMKFFQKLTFLVVKDDGGFYGGVMAATPNHPIMIKAEELLNRNYILDRKLPLPDGARYPCTQYQKIYFSAPPLITTAFFNGNNHAGYNDIVLPSWIAQNMDFARFKNKNCKYNAITKKFLQNANDNLDKIMQDFIKNFKKSDSVGGYNNRNLEPKENNIFYNIDFRNDYPIIGAETNCGSWSQDPSVNKIILYWNIFN